MSPMARFLGFSSSSGCEKNYSTFKRSGIGLSFWSEEPGTNGPRFCSDEPRFKSHMVPMNCIVEKTCAR